MNNVAHWGEVKTRPFFDEQPGYSQRNADKRDQQHTKGFTCCLLRVILLGKVAWRKGRGGGGENKQHHQKQK